MREAILDPFPRIPNECVWLRLSLLPPTSPPLSLSLSLSLSSFSSNTECVILNEIERDAITLIYSLKLKHSLPLNWNRYKNNNYGASTSSTLPLHLSYVFRTSLNELLMPLLDIATAQQPCFHNHGYTIRAQTFIPGKFIFNNDKRLTSTWISFQIPNKRKRLYSGRIEARGGQFMIRAVATLELKCLLQSDGRRKSYGNSQPFNDPGRSSVILSQSSSKDSDSDSEELDEREKLRRMRISQANKGNTPWNKGRKHSAETRQRIRERTKIAMQNPKVKMKLLNLGHAQSEETRIKIGVGVRIGWERRREKLMLQETCHSEWQNLIADASRRGFVGEGELQWNSYEKLDKLLEQEWLESVELRKNTPRPKGSKRAPKSPEQRRKISEAISAKWADPGYRDRVCSALAKFHGTPVGAERKPRRKPSGDRPPRIRTPAKKKVNDLDNSSPRMRTPAKKKVNDLDNSSENDIKIQSQQSRLKRRNTPLYKDPLASSKLEMIKNIREQRASAETKKNEAIERAKLLIAEAEKAAKALEVAATRSPLAQASLIETRKLIAEAIQSIGSIEIGQIDSHENGRHPSFTSNKLPNHVEDETDEGIESLSKTNDRKINGLQAFKESSEHDIKDLSFGKHVLQDLFNGKTQPPTSLSDYGSPNDEEKSNHRGPGENGFAHSELDNMINQSSFTQRLGEHQPNGTNKQKKMPRPNGSKFQTGKEEIPSNAARVTKKWVCGRLVELPDGD